MLLTMMASTATAWGQTRDEVVVYTLDGTQTVGSAAPYNAYASASEVTQNDITWQVYANTTMSPWRIGGKGIENTDRDITSTTTMSNAISKVEVSVGATASGLTVNSIKLIVASDASFNTVLDQITKTESLTSTTLTYTPTTGAEWATGAYYKIVFNVTRTSTSGNGYVAFNNAKFYKETGTALQDSDLSLSPTALTFDLYNDANAKTINISTSSTGTITVSNNAHVNTVVNGVATIIVTPVSVTSEAQTITVSQAADNTYNAGEASFTVSVANSTPTYTVTYKANGGTGDDIVDTYYQGNDVTVRSNTFVYTGHAFTKWNTAADGTGTDYQPAASIENIATNYTLYAQWEESNEVVDQLTASWTGVSGTTYESWSNKSVEGGSGAVYAGKTSNNNGIGLRTKNSEEGIITTASGGYARKVSVVWKSTTANRSVQVYGKNTPYNAVTDLFDTNKQGDLLGTIVYNTSTEISISGDYAYIGLRSANDALVVDPINITWEPGGSTTPSITANDVEIECSATSGNIEYTINNGVSGGAITASTESDWLTLPTEFASPIHFTCTANNANTARTATVTLTYTYNAKATVTKSVTVTQAGNPNTIYTTIQALFDAATSTATNVNITFDSWVISAVKNSNAYLTDNQGNGLIIYASNHGFQVNDVLTGTASCKLQLYRGSAELTELTSSTEGLTVTHNGTVTEQSIAINTLGGVNTGALLTYNNLTYNGTALVDDDNNAITPYNTLYSYSFVNGKTYNVKGIYLQYNQTKELLPRSADDIEVVNTEVADPVFNPAAGTYAEAQSVTMSCTTEGAAIHYTTDGSEPDGNSNVYTTGITVSETTTFKAKAIRGSDMSSVVTAVYHINSQNNPYTVAQALAAPLPATDVYVQGIVSTITEVSTEHGNATYNISDDGSTTSEMVVYRGKYLGGENFTSADQIQVGDIVVIKGNISTYNNANQLASGNHIVTLTRPVTPSITLDNYEISVDATEHLGTWNVAYNNIETDLGASIYWYTDNTGSTTTDEPDWISTEVNAEFNIDYLIEENSGAERTAYFKVYGLDGELNDIYSDLVTVTQAAGSVTPTGDKYVKVTSSSDFTDGQYLIVYEEGGLAFDGSLETLDASGNTISVNISNNGIPVTSTTAASEFTIAAITDGYSIQSASGYYIGQTSDANGMKTSKTEEYANTISIDAAGNADVLASGGAYMRYNATSGQERFRYFKSSTYTAQKAIQLYKKVEDPSAATIAVSPATVSATTEETNGTLAITYTNLDITEADDFDIQFYDGDGNELTEDPDWIAVYVVAGASSDYEVSYLIEENTGNARIAYFKVFAEGDADFVYSNLVTVNQAAPSGPAEYVLVTDASQIVSGMHYIITNGTDGNIKAMKEQTNNNRAATDITASNENIDDIAEAYEFVINGSDGHYTIYDKQYPGYLYAASNSSNHLKTRAENSDGNSEWTITIDGDGKASIIANGNNSHNTMRYNSGSNIFSCYSDGQQDIYLFVKDDDANLEFYGCDLTFTDLVIEDGESITIGAGSTITVSGTISNDDNPNNLIIADGGQFIYDGEDDFYATQQKDITSWNAKSVSGWYLIASPAADVDVSGLIGPDGTYDLFWYNEPTYQWCSHNGGVHPFNSLDRGWGYLYANQSDVILNFAGVMKPTNSQITVPLSHEGSLLTGFNLLGNPFTRELGTGDMKMGATEIETYYFSEGGDKLEVLEISEQPIKPGRGFMIQTSETDPEDVLVFNPTTKGSTSTHGYIKIMAGNDNAFIKIGGGNTLRKMNIANTTKVYVMNDDKDYAAARVEELAGTMPVHFKAAEDGEYTITIEAVNADVEYMHLIDNFTGEDIDLLLESSYTFNATTNDSEARFRLDFGTYGVNEIAENNTFAYQYGNEIVVNGEGELQIFDLMGRMIMNTKINGVQSVNVPSNSVYILKLNNNIQKIVVK